MQGTENTADALTADAVRLAPGGRPSHLNAEQYEQVRSPEFRARIGDWESWARLRKGYDALLNVARNVRDVPQAMRRDDLGDITFY